MGRPRQFDVEQALRTAAGLFWRQGFDGTSVQDLTEAMGITPPSFYFAFGSKEALFRRAVEDYQQVQARVVEAALRQSTAQAMLEHLLNGFAELLTNPAHAPGCLMMNNALPVTQGHPFRELFAEQREAFRLRIQHGLEGLGSRKSQARARARLIVAIIWGFAVEAQSGASPADLREAVRASAALWT